MSRMEDYMRYLDQLLSLVEQCKMEFQDDEGRRVDIVGLIKTESLSLMLAKMEKGAKFPLHMHLWEERLRILSGTFRVQFPTLDDKILTATAGHEMIIPADLPHLVLPCPEECFILATVGGPDDGFPDMCNMHEDIIATWMSSFRPVDHGTQEPVVT